MHTFRSLAGLTRLLTIKYKHCNVEISFRLTYSTIFGSFAFVRPIFFLFFWFALVRCGTSVFCFSWILYVCVSCVFYDWNHGETTRSKIKRMIIPLYRSLRASAYEQPIYKYIRIDRFRNSHLALVWLHYFVAFESDHAELRTHEQFGCLRLSFIKKKNADTGENWKSVSRQNLNHHVLLRCVTCGGICTKITPI